MRETRVDTMTRCAVVRVTVALGHNAHTLQLLVSHHVLALWSGREQGFRACWVTGFLPECLFVWNSQLCARKRDTA